MKKIIALVILTLAIAARAQINYVNLTTLATNVTTSSAQITLPGICTNLVYTVVNSNNVIIGDTIPTAFGKINSSFNYVSNQLALLAQLPFQFNTNLAAFTNYLATNSPPTNYVQSCWGIVLTNLNPLTFTGSNYIGQFNQLFSFQLTTPLLGGGGSVPPTNQFEELVISTNGTTWWALTNNGGGPQFFGQMAIFQPVYLAVIGAVGNSGALTVNGLSQTNLWGRTNSLIGEDLQVSGPVNPADAATKSYVDTHSGTFSPWLTSTDTNAYTHCSYSFNSLTVADLASSTAYIRVDSLLVDSTGTNVILSLANTNLVPAWAIHGATNLNTAMGSWPVYTNYTLVTNSGELKFTIPINFTAPAQFFLAEGTGSNWITLSAPVTVGGPVSGNAGGLTNVPAGNLAGTVPLLALGNAITNWGGQLIVTNPGTGNSIIITNGQVLIDGFPALTNNIHTTGTPTISTNVGGEYSRVLNANGDQSFTVVTWFTNAPATTAGTKIFTLTFANPYVNPPVIGYTSGLSSDGTFDDTMRSTVFVWGVSTTGAVLYVSSAGAGNSIGATGKYYTNYITVTGQ